jgi:DNA-binding protein HU-beta
LANIHHERLGTDWHFAGPGADNSKSNGQSRPSDVSGMDHPEGHEIMSKKDLIDAVAKECDLTKEKAGVAVDAMLEHIKSTMKDGNEVRLPDFGTFKVAKRKARDGRNPATGATIKIAASRVAKFTPSKGLKDALNA